MPSPVYNNKTLAEQERKRKFSIDVEKAPSKLSGGSRERSEPSIDQLLAEARSTLGRADELEASRDADAAQQTENIANLEQDQPSVFDSAATKLGRLGRRIVRPIPAAAEGAAGVGMFLAPEVAIPSKILLGAMSGGRLASGGTERLKEHPILSAMDVAGLGLGASGLRSALKPAAAAFNAERAGVSAGLQREARQGAVGAGRGPSTEVPYRAGSGVSGRPSLEATTEFSGPSSEGRAFRELSTPGSLAYQESQFAKNNPLAQQILGRERVGGPAPAVVEAPVEKLAKASSKAKAKKAGPKTASGNPQKSRPGLSKAPARDVERGDIALKRKPSPNTEYSLDLLKKILAERLSK